MIEFQSLIQRIDKKGEKTGWTFVEITEEQAQKLKPANKKAFRVKGFLDKHPIAQVALIPMGDGSFILPLNQSMRKATKKKEGDKLSLKLQEDTSPILLDPDLVMCLEDDEQAQKHFDKLTRSHQNYFSKWIASAKTEETKSKRIAQALDALSKGWGYPEMIRANKKVKD